MTAPDESWRPRRLHRSPERQLLGGVAGGLAAHLGVDPAPVRIAFVALTAVNGIGVLAYAALWVLVPLGDGTPVRARQQRANPRLAPVPVLAALVVGALLVAQALGSGLPGAVLVALVAVGVGVVLLWRQADEAQRTRWRSMGGGYRGWGLVRSAAGVVLVVAGGALFLAARGELGQALDGLVGSAVIVTGVGLVFGPYWLRMARELGEERRARIRSQERAELAAQVHDSVLHTLTLIQRNVDDPRAVTRLARAQERELRGWLYPSADDAERTLAAAVRRLAAEVEDAHGAQIEVVCVGDCGLDARLSALLQASREAMVNAAKYAGEEPISVYAEVEPDQVTLFVRDRGAGFDLEEVPADRLGVRESIVGRMRRNGGAAMIRPGPGGGTEVQLEIARIGNGSTARSAARRSN